MKEMTDELEDDIGSGRISGKKDMGWWKTR